MIGDRAKLRRALAGELPSKITDAAAACGRFGMVNPHQGREVMRRIVTTLLAGAGLAFALANTALAEELTIFWAEWDPANYLQELVNDYTKETGVKVTV